MQNSRNTYLEISYTSAWAEYSEAAYRVQVYTSIQWKCSVDHGYSPYGIHGTVTLHS